MRVRRAIALSALLLAAFTAIRPGAYASDRVHAFYYLWYGTPETDGRWLHWNHEVLPHWFESVTKQYPAVRFRPEEGDPHSPFFPLLGTYSSRNRTVLAQHFAWMKRAGIGVAVISWWGRPDVEGTHDTQGVGTDDVVPLVLDEAERADVRIAFHLEPYRGRSADSVRRDLQYLMGRFGTHPALHRASRRCLGIKRWNRPTDRPDLDPALDTPLPVVYVYDSYHIPARDWARILHPADPNDVESPSIRTPATGLDVIAIGLWLDRAHLDDLIEGGFDGAYTYFAADRFSFGSTPAQWASMATSAASRGLLFVPSVGPGYDDSKIRPWNTVYRRARDGQRYYARQWTQALDTRPLIVSITSFNEFGEGTQIEPAVPHVVPNETGLPDDIRSQLHAPRVYADYGDAGPFVFLDATNERSRELDAIPRPACDPAHDEF